MKLSHVLVKAAILSVPALALIWCGAIGFMYLLKLLALEPLYVLSVIGVLTISLVFVDLIWHTYFWWASKRFMPEYHKIWFPEDR